SRSQLSDAIQDPMGLLQVDGACEWSEEEIEGALQLLVDLKLVYDIGPTRRRNGDQSKVIALPRAGMGERLLSPQSISTHLSDSEFERILSECHRQHSVVT